MTTPENTPRPSVTHLPEPPPVTVVEVVYPAHRGTIGLRGSHAPLSWDHTQPPTMREGDRHVFSLEVAAGELVELKLVRNDEDWAQGRNFTVHGGDHMHLEPHFDRADCTLEPRATIEADGETLAFHVLLPPSYEEQEKKRYPVLYVQDGQSMWSTSQDPYGVWHLDTTMNQLYEIGAVEEIIVVAVETSERRIERLSPVPDPEHGGGEAKAHLARIAGPLRAHINATYRTRTEREHTGLLGSSMGGLFAFFGAWSKPDVFGKAACLSSSFWWSDRHAVRMVQQGVAPSPRPMLYLDSGAALSPMERDANVRDGFHHTGSMVRALVTHGWKAGVDLHRLTFPGSTHDAASWAARVSIPLQVLFPIAERLPPPRIVAAATDAVVE